ncbi:MAG: SAM hydrolase/SAM-dependent halogenase family protein [bacterium]
MAIITLTTDFGEKDHFVGAIKGAIFTELPEAKIVDISHTITPFSIPEAAYIIQNAYNSFPKGTIHIIGIDSELNEENKHIAVKLDDHYFICANNGIMSMICAEINPQKIVEINIHDKIETSFPVLDVFVKVACHVSRGGTLEIIGREINTIKPIRNLAPLVNNEQTQIIGSVIYIDNYGNVVTNIKKKFFESIQKGRTFEIAARNHKFSKIHTKFSDIVDFSVSPSKRNDEGKSLIVTNSAGYLEIALYRGSTKGAGGASNLLGLDMRDTITVTFNKLETTYDSYS